MQRDGGTCTRPVPSRVMVAQRPPPVLGSPPGVGGVLLLGRGDLLLRPGQQQHDVGLVPADQRAYHVSFGIYIRMTPGY